MIKAIGFIAGGLAVFGALLILLSPQRVDRQHANRTPLGAAGAGLDRASDAAPPTHDREPLTQRDPATAARQQPTELAIALPVEADSRLRGPVPERFGDAPAEIPLQVVKEKTADDAGPDAVDSVDAINETALVEAMFAQRPAAGDAPAAGAVPDNASRAAGIADQPAPMRQAEAAMAGLSPKARPGRPVAEAYTAPLPTARPSAELAPGTVAEPRVAAASGRVGVALAQIDDKRSGFEVEANPAFDGSAPSDDSVDKQWFAVWDPFHSEISAKAFARRLEMMTGLDYRVVRSAPAKYEVAVGFTDERERVANVAVIEDATGLRIAGGSL